MAAEYNPWAFSSGLPDEMHGTITEAWFQPNDDGDRINLHMNIMSDDPEIGDGGLYENRVSVGSDEDWEVLDKGQTVRSRKSERKVFNKNGGIATLCMSAIAAGVDLGARGKGTPFDAGIWVGIEADFKRKDYKNTRKDGEVIEWSWLLFDDGSGSGTEAAGAAANGASSEAAAPTPPKATPRKAAAGKATPAPATPAANGAPADVTTDGEVDYGLSKGMVVGLTSIARQHADHGAFMEAAFEKFPQIAGDAAAEAAVMDAGDASLWATAQSA